MTWKAIIFDLDGTLLDTIEDLADSMNLVLDRRGLPVHPVEKYNYFVGDGVEQLARRALPGNRQDEETVNQVVKEMREEYKSRWDAKSCPYPGIDELLDGLAERNIRKTVLSNKPDHFTKMMVEKMLDVWSFEYVYGERQGIAIKPDPAGALEIARQLGLEPSEILYLGDTNTDMKTATAAGMYALGAAWGFRPPEELLDNGARIILDHPADLLDLIDEQAD